MSVKIELKIRINVMTHRWATVVIGDLQTTRKTAWRARECKNRVMDTTAVSVRSRPPPL